MANRRELMDAEFALNEGAWGQLDEQGNRVALLVEAGEKTSQNFSLEVTNIGGHSSVPLPDNAIYHLADAIRAIRAHEFPVQINDANRAYLRRMAKVAGGARGAAMADLAANPLDSKAAALLSKTPTLNAMLRTTCVVTQITAGHAPNALPQRAAATVNCRIFPGVSRDQVRQTLIDIIADPAVTVTRLRVARTEGDDPPPPLTPKIMGPIEKVAGEIWPGVPVVPVLQAAATDGRALSAGGIPTYGVSGLFFGADLGNIHGLNERIGVTSLFEGRDFLYRLVKLYANQRN
jgi:acetylornithine deacetylase/succinyl-diaminopimelate desuccinylase-like protein